MGELNLPSILSKKSLLLSVGFLSMLFFFGGISGLATVVHDIEALITVCMGLGLLAIL